MCQGFSITVLRIVQTLHALIPHTPDPTLKGLLSSLSKDKCWNRERLKLCKFSRTGVEICWCNLFKSKVIIIVFRLLNDKKIYRCILNKIQYMDN